MLTGTLVGVLAKDAAGVVANFSTAAMNAPPNVAGVGAYPIAVSLSGAASGNYVAGLSAGSGALQIVQATPIVAVSVPAAAYAGLPLTLTATVVSPTRGTPTGVVSFLDAGAVVGTANLSGGVASFVDLNVSAGAHAFAAAYAGDANFVAGTSGVAAITAGAMPDFAVASTTAQQTVSGGAIAVYALQVSPVAGAFSGSIHFSASGLPPGATVSFSPAAVVPGGNIVPVTMSVQTVALGMLRMERVVVLALVMVPLMWRRRRRLLAVTCLLLMAGCGARTVATRAGSTFTVTVTGTSTNLAGAVVTHSTQVALTVE